MSLGDIRVIRTYYFILVLINNPIVNTNVVPLYGYETETPGRVAGKGARPGPAMSWPLSPGGWLAGWLEARPGDGHEAGSPPAEGLVYGVGAS